MQTGITPRVDIWRVDLDIPSESIQPYRALLTENELERAARYHRPTDRCRFTVARAALRTVLGQALDTDPAGLRFIYGAAGKPAIDPALTVETQFNLSHSHRLALIALTPDHRVGVDVEHMTTDASLADIARRFFSPDEHQALLALPERERQTAFYRCWTRKEAYLKATGAGLSKPLDSFDVSLMRSEPARLLRDRHQPDAAQRWTLRSLEVPAAYQAALAVEAPAVHCRRYDFDPL